MPTNDTTGALDNSARRVARKLWLGLNPELFTIIPGLRILDLIGTPCEHFIEARPLRGGMSIKGIFAGKEQLLIVSIDRRAATFTVGAHHADKRDLTTGSLEVTARGEVLVSNVTAPMGPGSL